MNEPIELSREQQFTLQVFKNSVRKMDLEQAQDYLEKLYTMMLMRETMYRQLRIPSDSLNSLIPRDTHEN